MPPHPFGCAVLTEDPGFVALVRQAFEKEAGRPLSLEVDGTVDDAVHQIQDLRRTGTGILVAQLGESVEGSAEAVRRLASLAPELSVVIAGRPLDSRELLELIRAGAVEYLPTPVTDDELTDALRRITQRRTALSDGETPTEGRCYGVLGPKGGAGVTTVAVNLALQLQVASDEPVALADLDVFDGGVEVLLDLQPRYTLMDLVRNEHRMDQGLLGSFLVLHDSGLAVLAGPRTGLEGEQLTPSQVAQAVRQLRQHHGRVVLDLGNALTAATLAALDETDEILMVLSPGVECLRSAKRTRAALKQHVERLDDRLHLVLNRTETGGLISPAEVCRVLEVELDAELPRDDDLMRRCATAGRPAALDGGSKFARELRALCRDLGELDGDPDHGLIRSFIGGLISRNGRNGAARTETRANTGR